MEILANIVRSNESMQPFNNILFRVQTHPPPPGFLDTRYDGIDV